MIDMPTAPLAYMSQAEADRDQVTPMRRVSPAEWDATLDRLGVFDIYFRYPYVATATLLEAGEPVFLLQESGSSAVVYVAILREIPGGSDRDLVTPYGYGGPLAIGSAAPMALFEAQFADWCLANRVVTGFIRFHPLLENYRTAPSGYQLQQLAGTVAWRLAPDRDLLLAMHGKHRNVVRKAQTAGLTVQVVEQPSSLTAFAELYEVTMRRQAAAQFYFFPSVYWRALEESLKAQLIRFDALLHGEVVASALCFATAPWLHYHLGATAEAARSLGASNLVLYEAARWAQGHGFERFHLGGGVGGRDDTLLAFKRRFDPEGDCASYIGKVVHDSSRYRELTGRDDVAGFFPAYRTAL